MNPNTMNTTPGPWNFYLTDKEGEIGQVAEIVAGDHQVAVATVNGYGARRLPNARLIAAAPEMLAILKSFKHPGLWGLVSNAWGEEEAAKLCAPLWAVISKADPDDEQAARWSGKKPELTPKQIAEGAAA